MGQLEKVVRHIERFGSITPAEAVKEYGIYRLSAIAYTMKKRGYPIHADMEQSVNRFGEKTKYARYSMR